MECPDNDKLKPLDKLLNDKISEFESGLDRICDRDLDSQIWELGDYENEEPPLEASEFKEEAPVEEQLIEKKMTRGHKGRTSFTEE